MDPFAPPESDFAGHTSAPFEDLGPVRFTVPSPTGFKWRATFHETHLHLAAIDGDKRYAFALNELPKVASLVFMPGGAIGLTVRGAERIVINIPSEQQPLLRRWLDPVVDQMMLAPLKKGRASRGFFFMFCLLFLALDFSVLWIVLTTWNAAMFGAAFIRPHRIVFLFQSVVSFGLVAYFGYAIAALDSPIWVGIFVFFILLSALNSFRLFRFYGLEPTPLLEAE